MTAQDKALKENTASAPLQIVAPGTCVETGEQAALVLGMYDHLVETIHQYNPSADFAQIDKAFRYADTHHNGQLRKDGSPFITHPLAVAQIIAEELRLDSESIEAALMHDCIEDTSATYAEIAKEFSPAVADLVEGVSKLTRVQYASKEEEQMENLRKMLMAMAKDIRVILIKLADRTHNMRTMEYQTAEKQRQKSLETMEIYAPIAHRLGMQRIKWELEDLSLKYLDPVGYDEITRSLAAKEAEHEAFMERVQAQIEERLKDQHVPYLKVYGRMKHPYSIYRKMYAQNKTMDEVLDLFAFRVIVDTVADCYKRARHHPRPLPSHSGPFQGLYRHAQAEHVPVAPHHRHRCGRHPVRGPNSHRRDARDRRIRRRRALEVQTGHLRQRRRAQLRMGAPFA